MIVRIRTILENEVPRKSSIRANFKTAEWLQHQQKRLRTASFFKKRPNGPAPRK